MAEPKADIALIGLAVMGQNLILNMDSKGFVVCAYNRTVEKVDYFLANEAKGTKVIGAKSLEDMVQKLKKPKKVMLLVKAGSAVDAFVKKLLPLLKKGDIIIDGGNSQYTDTKRWCKKLSSTGILYIGMGVSGGEDGARYGPSLMLGGHADAWPAVKPIFQAICAKVDNEPCCDWVGEDGAGHFVKMVHNGIEYGDMQLICEAYHFMKDLLNLDQGYIARVFEGWGTRVLDSFLIDITAKILRFKDSDDQYLLPKIRDAAGQKGTGKWTVNSALEYGVPVTLIGEAVFARCLSALKDERSKAHEILPSSTVRFGGDKGEYIDYLEKALFASKVISYAQGFMLLREAAKGNNWHLNYGSIALMWRGGYIIRSSFLGKIKEAFTRNPSLENLLLDPRFTRIVSDSQMSLRRVIAQAALSGVPMPTMSAALTFYDAYSSRILPANLLQAQRDYFGAHTYEFGEFVHTNWTGRDGNVSASTYNRPKADIALIGLAVMGQNLILNMDSKGFVVCAYNRTVEKVDHFLANEAKGTKVIGAKSLEDMVQKLKKPRKVMLLVKAGSAVNELVKKLLPLLKKGDIIIDGGNSQYTDTQRWCKKLSSTGILYIGMGVSGGENGARYGPSLMPGGHADAWPAVKPIFQAICAKVDNEPCCDWVGEDGAGHFVKMVHNGIEYGDMQLICEAYHFMKDLLNLDQGYIARVFEDWGTRVLDSVLIDITAKILRFKDSDGKYLLPKIRDAAGQKGTDKWTVNSALEYGVPVTLIGETVFARCLSALKDERSKAHKILPSSTVGFGGDKGEYIDYLEEALFASKVISYAQGFMLLREAAKGNNWHLNYGSIALMWRGGCITRSSFLGKIEEAFTRNPSLENLLLDPYFTRIVSDSQMSLRRVIAQAALSGVPMPTLSAALTFYDAYSSRILPANLLQAQRDYFGAHTYELLKKPGEFVHTNWTGHGGNVSASTYNK